MEIGLSDITSEFREAHRLRRSDHTVLERLRPRVFQYDYLCLKTLAADIERLIAALPNPSTDRVPVALDIGCRNSPYRSLIESRGFELKTLDVDASGSPDFIGTVEASGLPDAVADLVLCTQVLEHSIDPSQGAREIYRILRPGGHLIASAPHVWFYHPHPSDNWRFTQEGLVRLIESAGFKPLMLLSQGGSVLAFFQVVNFLIYGSLGRIGAALYAINNMLGQWGDRLIRDTLFCHNFAILALKQ